MAKTLYELETSLKDRAKFKSLGVKGWVDFDPSEFVRGQPLPDQDDWEGPGLGSQLDQLLSLIAFAEAGPKQYDAVHYSAKIRPPKSPTSMTIGEVQRWARSTPGQPHAIGRYQFIPKTLNRLVKKLGMSKKLLFNANTQDQLAAALLNEAGFVEFQSGKISQNKFMDGLARIWAGLPTRTGRSYYHNYAGNRATITRRFYAKEMKKIFGN